MVSSVKRKDSKRDWTASIALFKVKGLLERQNNLSHGLLTALQQSVRFNANLSCATVRVGRLIGRPPLSQHTSTRGESVYWRKYVRLVAIRNVSASCYWAFFGVRFTSHTKQVEKRQTGCTARWKHGLFGTGHYVIHIVLIPSSSFFVLFFQASCYGFTPWATSGSMPGAGTVVQRPRPAQVRLRRIREK